ncbi:MAG TPA: MG2 domain-containing protein, partial [Chryseolinea sp.]
MRRRNRILALGFVAILFTSFTINEEPSFVKKLREKLKEFNAKYPEEKIYVQSDKSFYKPGDDVWLNVFVLNGNTYQPTLISDVVYVELINPKGNIESTLELVVQEGTAHADFQLSESTPGGIYKIQAYTRWMRNSGKETFFTKEITVQRVLTPRLLLKLEYKKESYGPRDTVEATLEILNLKNQKIEGASVEATVRIHNKKIFNAAISSDSIGEAHIRFALPDTLSSTDGLLSARVKANGIEESISRSIPITLDKITLQFFPEGGHYVENIRNRIAFKAVNEYGKGADLAGVVVDESNNVVATLESYHMGMGAFDITATPGKKYYARIEKPFENRTLIPLPSPLPRGFTLGLNHRDSTSLEFQVFSANESKAYLTATVHGELVYSQELGLQSGTNRVNISTGNFPAGIAVFTLFNESGLEQCERLVFLNNHKSLTIKLEPDKKQYQPRETVKLKITTLDEKGQPNSAKLSISVIDDQLTSFANDKQDNIISRLLLSSEVKGEIQEPAFYFDDSEKKAALALDYLLMTQGWRRFKWQEVFALDKNLDFVAERIKNLSGVLQDNKGQGYSSEVTLIELGGKKRIVKLKTTQEGHFLFRNIDPKIPVLLLSKKPGQIVINKNLNFSISLNDREGTVTLPKGREEIALSAPILEGQANITELPQDVSSLDVDLESDVAQLSEVVVTGYGVEEKRAFAGAVVRVTENSVEGLFAASAVENSLQGRVAGIVIQPQTGSPAGQTNMMIRGLSSLSAGRGEPLYVIDGHVIGTSLNKNFPNSSILGPDNILSIEVITSPEATALYGSAASNGAILISTRTRLGYGAFKSQKKPSKFSSLTVAPRKFSATREFYAPASTDGKNAETRKDFRTTVHWSHTIVTDKNGEAEVSFKNNDAVSAFRITAEGFSGAGLIGRKEEVYHTEMPLSLDAKLPEFLGFEDVLKLPIYVNNETSSSKTVNVTLNLPDGLSLDGSSSKNIEIKPKTRGTVWFTIRPNGTPGNYPISIVIRSEKFTDQLIHNIQVRPIGFPMRISFSAKEMDKTVKFDIRDVEQNSVKAELTAFPDILSDLFVGAESILREPHGCFEQVSSSTFPNILALQFLKESGLSKPDVEKLALRYISNGYDKLMAYEIKGGGFEWFGHPPAHEGLTAYGLLQFSEMKKVFTGVDDDVISRTRQWLLDRKNGKGGFKQSTGKYGFSAASEDVTNAYIVYALSEIGTREIMPEYMKAYDEVVKSKDMYRMALIACAAYNLEREEDYLALIELFKIKIQSSGFNSFKAEHSIVRSYGNSLQSETISQWCTALMKSRTPDLTLLDKCIEHLLKTRSYGQFGSTQGTTVALKALTEYAKLVRTTGDNGSIQILVNDVLADQINYERESRGKLTSNKFSQYLSTGTQNLQIRFQETKNPLPYSVDVQWFTKKPMSSQDCKVSLSTLMSNSAVLVNETARLSVTIENKVNEGLPMTVAQIGIPAG